ncbi:hypothetical protein BJY01DRAFT_239735 [Aspergillus pseudoustus]|uniref:Zn(2)-C6 fungal-type domain-containing protein n=1 Tax=Aspergillus pseudoustus TaxID=1810923 RepID=A0ABR4IY93_9EURO
MSPAAIAPRKHGRKDKGRVKSGCRTCKVRKVKCDENFPVCQRCLSTGRVCDGYGVWGGGGNVYGNRQSPTSLPDTPDYSPLSCISTPVASTDEKASFDWFKRRTITKIPGSYVSDFWTTILLQASQSDEAVWHAVLALSSTHRSGCVHNIYIQRSKQEQSTLRHLIRATRHLEPHFSVRDRASCRVILIVCLVFVVLDLLRGHFTSAQVHLRNGLNILAQTQSAPIEIAKGSVCPSSSSYPYEPIDISICEAFFRFHSQVELLQHQHHPRPCILPPPVHHFIHVPSSPTQFPSYTAAWRGLDHVMNQAFRLSAHGREHIIKAGPEAAPTDTLLTQQEQLKIDLKNWLDSYNTSREGLQVATSESIAEAKAKVHHLVSCYHTMITIMAETALSSRQTVFDAYTHHFEQMIEHLADLWTLSSINYPTPSSYTSSSSPSSNFATTSSDSGSVPWTEKKPWIGGCNMSHTIIDVGWMIPLFYTAIKCRVRRIRRRAIRLVESSDHREGIWDAKITACIARRAVEFEEGDFYDCLGVASSSDVDIDSESASTTAKCKDEPVLPESCRIRDLEVRMEGDPVQKVMLFGGWEGMAGGTVCMGEYNVDEQRWL